MKFLKQLITWHSECVDDLQRELKLTNYQMLWISFLKGLVIGILIAL